MNSRLKQLSVFAGMIKDAEFSKLRAAQSARHCVTAKRSDLLLARTEAATLPGDPSAHMSGALSRWQNWCDKQLTRLSAEEAQAAANAEMQKRAAARAFGRANVLDRLVRGSK